MESKRQVAAMDKREFLTEVGKILELRPNKLNGPEALGSHGWDSAAVIAFQAFLDSRFSVGIDCAHLAACDTFDELFQLSVDAVNHEAGKSDA